MRRTTLGLVHGLAVALVLGLVTALVAVTGPATAAAPAAPTGPVTCSGDLAHSGGTPVLLVPGTTLTPQQFSWNYEKVFTEQGRAWCAVTLPQNAMGDVQVAGEIVADAIRTTYAQAGGKIAVVGHSQGGMVPRWALKFWPDTRAMVSDLIGLAPSNHGTVLAHPVCALTCAPAIWQQRTGSAFLTALNRGGETYPRISYTQVYSATDEVVVPNLPFPTPASSMLTTGGGDISNILIQSVCPLALAEHLSTGTSDPVGYAAVIDAITHDGPAKKSRISRSTCFQGIFAGIDPVAFPFNFAGLAATAGHQLLFAPRVAAEPALAAYAR